MLKKINYNKIILFLSVLIFPLILGQTTSSEHEWNSTKHEVNEYDFEGCTFVPEMKNENESHIDECCSQTQKNFYMNWDSGNYDLTTYLLTLRSQGCTQFEDECNNRFFVMNSFSGLIFDYFCNYTNFVEECFTILNRTYTTTRKNNKEFSKESTKINSNEDKTKMVISEEKNISNVANWRKLVKALNSSLLTINELLQPCIQIALYEAEVNDAKDYFEILHMSLPTCPPVWCGFDGTTIRNRFISIWTCLSSGCRNQIIVFMLFCGILAIAVTIVNLSVILVYVLNPNLLQSQAIYKLSLAFADIIAGFIVYPTFISSLCKMIFGRIVDSDYNESNDFNLSDGNLFENSTIVKERSNFGHFSILFDSSYLNTVGFFTTLSFLVSVYTLTVAGFDRLIAIYKPLGYRRDRAKNQAIVSCVAVWCIGIIFALLPSFTPSLKYGLIGSILVSSSGQSALILYAAVFLIPLMLMWIVTTVVYCLAQKYARIRRQMVSNCRNANAIDVRLAKTLAIIVGVFNLCILPITVVIIAAIFIPSIHTNIPQTFNHNDNTAFQTAESITVLILASNSLWNFFIYNGRNAEFRQTFKEMHKNLRNKIGLKLSCCDWAKCKSIFCPGGKRRLSIFSFTLESKSSSSTSPL